MYQKDDRIHLLSTGLFSINIKLQIYTKFVSLESIIDVLFDLIFNLLQSNNI